MPKMCIFFLCSPQKSRQNRQVLLSQVPKPLLRVSSVNTTERHTGGCSTASWVGNKPQLGRGGEEGICGLHLKSAMYLLQHIFVILSINKSENNFLANF